MVMKKEKTIQPFQLVALEKLSKIIADRYTGTEITNFFHKAGFRQFFHDGSTKWRFVYNVLQEIQNEYYGPYNVLKIIETLCNPQEFIGELEKFEEIVTAVNEILRFYGLKVDLRDGKVKRTEISTHVHDSEEKRMFYARNFHYEIRKHGEELFLEKRYFHAVFECCKAFDKYVREKSKIEKFGSELMSAALSMNGTLKLNKQISTTDRNEQEGIMLLCMGVMRAVRNPKSHEPALEWKVSREDALDILSLLSFLYRQIDRAQYFSM
jgi:uncharacterized protein (TIGR02391 family)